MITEYITETTRHDVETNRQSSQQKHLRPTAQPAGFTQQRFTTAATWRLHQVTKDNKGELFTPTAGGWRVSAEQTVSLNPRPASRDERAKIAGKVKTSGWMSEDEDWQNSWWMKASQTKTFYRWVGFFVAVLSQVDVNFGSQILNIVIRKASLNGEQREIESRVTIIQL